MWFLKYYSQQQKQIRNHLLYSIIKKWRSLPKSILKSWHPGVSHHPPFSIKMSSSKVRLTPVVLCSRTQPWRVKYFYSIPENINAGMVWTGNHKRYQSASHRYHLEDPYFYQKLSGTNISAILGKVLSSVQFTFISWCENIWRFYTQLMKII